MSFELSDEEAEALFSDVYGLEHLAIQAEQRWRDTRLIEVGDIVHHTHLRAAWANRMEVLAVHDDQAWVLDGEGDYRTRFLSDLRKGERP